jgi:hypothetical protein
VGTSGTRGTRGTRGTSVHKDAKSHKHKSVNTHLQARRYSSEHRATQELASGEGSTAACCRLTAARDTVPCRTSVSDTPNCGGGARPGGVLARPRARPDPDAPLAEARCVAGSGPSASARAEAASALTGTSKAANARLRSAPSLLPERKGVGTAWGQRGDAGSETVSMQAAWYHQHTHRAG